MVVITDTDMDTDSMRINNDILASRLWLFRMFRETQLHESMALELDL